MKINFNPENTTNREKGDSGIQCKKLAPFHQTRPSEKPCDVSAYVSSEYRKISHNYRCGESVGEGILLERDMANARCFRQWLGAVL